MNKMNDIIRIILFFIFLGLLICCKPIEKTITFHSDMIGHSDPIVIYTSKRRIKKIKKKVEKCNIKAITFDRFVYITKNMIECDSTILNKKELKQIKN